MHNDTTHKTLHCDSAKVVEIAAYQRTKKNREFAEIVVSRWNEIGPASGRILFDAILSKAVAGPIATPERAEALLPVLLEVLDEMEPVDGCLTRQREGSPSDAEN